MNFNNGYTNTNTKSTNTYRVRPVSQLAKEARGPKEKNNDQHMVTLESLIEAYYECRRHKRSTRSALRFEMQWEELVHGLWESINDGTYRPSPSDAFIVERPTKREVFAAQFRDRVVHTWIAIRVEPLLEKAFTPRAFACRKGKGQLYGIQRLKRDVLECSKGYTKDCWICKLDIRGFFMSIDRGILWNSISGLLEGYAGADKEDLVRLAYMVVHHEPEKDCVLKSPPSKWEDLSPGKSLFTSGPGKGLPIGNHPSQLFANLYLDPLDKYLESLGFERHGRYADDTYIVHESKERILEAVPRIRAFLASLGLELHPRKFYLQHYKKGVSFTGSIVKPGRTYCEGRNADSFRMAVRRLDEAGPDGLQKAVARVNSYLGLLRHDDTYTLRYRTLLGMKNAWKYIYVEGHLEKVVIRKAYRRAASVADGPFSTPGSSTPNW